MTEPYQDRVARIYDWIVYGSDEAELGEDEWVFLRAAFDQAAGRPVRDVLDVGCGTGRHLLPLARAGYAVTALDNAPGMIAECRRRLDAEGLDAALRRADMADVDDREAFDAVLAMDSVITYLLDADDVVAVLRRFHAALRPGGLLVLDNHNLLHMWDTSDEPYHGEAGDEDVRISYVDRRWYDDFPSIFHVEIVAQVEENGETWEVVNEEVLKAMTADEVRHYLAAAGFADVRVLPGYELDAPPALTSERMVFLAVKEP